MSIKIQDPLFLLSAQTGMSAGELKAKAAEGNPDVNKAQAPIKIGEPIPIIFCRRRNSNGGVMVQPKMSEAFFSNDIGVKTVSEDGGTGYFGQIFEKIFIKYLLVLSDGNLAQLQVRDLFYGNSRKGTFNQVYNGRAGTWSPGNTIDDYIDHEPAPNAQGQYVFNLTNLAVGNTLKLGEYLYHKTQVSGVSVTSSIPYVDHELPTFTGTSGSYSGLTTLSFEYTENNVDDEQITKSVSVFVRSGLQVTRLVDGITGESDNFADLAKYLFQANNRLADDLIDNTALTVAAKFTDANGFFFNGELSKSRNFLDWLQATSTSFLLKVTNSGGKFGLKPRLPYNTDHTIKTTIVTPSFTFTEEHILPGGFDIEYIGLEDREPVCFVVQWRQQPEADFGLVRTVQVRYENEAANGPFIDLDMSNYCTNEDHAVKAGVYRLAQRKFVTHHLRLAVRERNYNVDLTVGDLVRVRLRRETSEGQVEYHDKIYEINRIEKTFAASITYDLTHFPIDALGRSIVAREVDAATGAGNTIDVGRSTFDGDVNSSTDTTTIGTASGGGGTSPGSADTSFEIASPADALVDDNGDPVLDPDGNQLTILDSKYPGGVDQTVKSNLSDDPLDEPIDDTTAATVAGSNTGYGGSSVTPGNTVEVAEADLPCGDGRVCFYRLDKSTGVKTLRECKTSPVSGKYSSSITTDDINYAIVVEGQCPDPSSPDGYGPAIDLGETNVVVPDPEQYTYARFKGTILTYQQVGGTGPFVETTVSVTTPWYQSDGASGNYLTIGTAYTAFGIIYDYYPLEVGLSENPYTLQGSYIEWTPAVNYYNGLTSTHVGTPGVYSVPWRAHVSASARKFFGAGGAGAWLGDVGGQGYSGSGLSTQPDPVPGISNTPAFYAFLTGSAFQDAPLRTASISGKWEFSNDQSEVLAEWEGTDDDGNPYTG